MTYPSSEPDLSAVCPYLGLGDDADSHATYATEAHRCYRMPSPTRIAQGHQESYCLVANHVACPIYTGEGIAGAGAAAAAAPATAATAPGPSAPRGGRKAPQAAQTAPGPRPAAPRPKRGAGDGQLRPRPRAGGISMPAATIGLFALAIVLIGIAFLINEAVDGNGSSALSEADAFATQNALRTADAANQTQSPNTPTTPTPGGEETPDGQETPNGEDTPPSGGGTTYTVESGDFCGSIAEAHGITLQELLDANDMVESDCNSLDVGQVLNIP